MASPEVKILDPNGDLLIIATASTDAFAPWYHHLLSSTNEISETEESDVSDAADDHRDIPRNELRIKASSSHLALASERFGRMMKNAWPDLAVVHEDGMRHWETEAVDLEAFVIVMDILHGRNRKVPHDVDVEMLAKVAVVVDDLQCHEAVEIFADKWISKLETAAPPKRYLQFSRDLVLWILIAAMFQHAEIFQSCTRIAILQIEGPMPSLELPIRGKVIDELESRRLKHLDDIMAILTDFENRLLYEELYCCFDCDSMLLGALIMQTRPSCLFNPRPSRPYNGISVSNMFEAVRAFRVPQIGDYGGWNSHSRGQEGFNELLFNRINSLEREIQGIQLGTLSSLDKAGRWTPRRFRSHDGVERKKG
ncbi:hypothetical protein F4810DRAFT_651156 [Camillea tinctor]|nr:hypothetical protein F4810DRAFT_651156 [Camillea tinctor]